MAFLSSDAASGPADQGYWRGALGYTAGLVVAVFTLAAVAYFLMSLVPTLGLYGPHHAFPAIRDPSSLVITLQRSLCYGTCASYRLEIHGDGSVIYNGADCVSARGERHGRIAPAMVARLVQGFRALDYFSLRGAYDANIPDAQMRWISIRFDNQSKTVVDAAGSGIGMPRGLEYLERAIDSAVGTQKWTYAGPRSCFGHVVDG